MSKFQCPNCQHLDTRVVFTRQGLRLRECKGCGYEFQTEERVISGVERVVPQEVTQPAAPEPRGYTPTRPEDTVDLADELFG